MTQSAQSDKKFPLQHTESRNLTSRDLKTEQTELVNRLILLQIPFHATPTK